MPPTATSRGRQSGPDHVDQLLCCSERAAPHDGRGDASGVPFVAVLEEHTSELALRVRVDDVARGTPPRAIHPHVERTVSHVAEAPLGLVDLRGADPEVEEHSDNLSIRVLL